MYTHCRNGHDEKGPSKHTRQPYRLVTPLFAVVALGGLTILAGALPAARAQTAPVDPNGFTGRKLVTNPPMSLKTVPTPEPANLNQFLQTDAAGVILPQAREAAIALGKALFWDQAVGSDGQACASCHFNAGADSRTRNQVNPGMRAIPSQTKFGATPPQQSTGVGAAFTADYQLRASDFPLTRFSLAGVRSSGIASDTQAVVSSEGVFNSMFGDITLSACPDDQLFLGVNICDKRSQDINGNGAVFNVASPPTLQGQVRNVEPRNTPTVINAVFNHRNFWDLRARNEFNGVSPIGDLDPYARVLMNSGNGGTLQKVSLSGDLRLENASLASQAVGPALSDMEMSTQQRSFPKLGKKILALRIALPGQLVAPDDSVLGDNLAANVKSNYPAKGINKSYADLIRAAFQPRWHASNQIVTFPGGTDADGTVKLALSTPSAPASLTTNQFTQMEANFSLFWGLAIQMYEATLRSDDSPFDQAFDSGDPLNFTSDKWGATEKAGLNVFVTTGKCLECHSGPEFTNSSIRNVTQVDGKLETMKMADQFFSIYDVGSYNTAIRRCSDQANGPAPCDDVGVGATIGPLNLPLSLARFSQMVQKHNPNDPRDPITIVCANQPAACNIKAVQPSERVAVDGAFKTPGLRNIELTAPYFHNGGELSLMDTVEAYERGGNFPEYNIQNLDREIGEVTLDQTNGDPIFRNLGLGDGEKAALVAFMKSLTDERVRYQRAPFDHPQLFVPNLGGESDPVTGQPMTIASELPAVGRNGSVAPLNTFADKLAPPPPVTPITPVTPVAPQVVAASPLNMLPFFFIAFGGRLPPSLVVWFWIVASQSQSTPNVTAPPALANLQAPSTIAPLQPTVVGTTPPSAANSQAPRTISPLPSSPSNAAPQPTNAPSTAAAASPLPFSVANAVFQFAEALAQARAVK